MCSANAISRYEQVSFLCNVRLTTSRACVHRRGRSLLFHFHSRWFLHQLRALHRGRRGRQRRGSHVVQCNVYCTIATRGSYQGEAYISTCVSKSRRWQELIRLPFAMFGSASPSFLDAGFGSTRLGSGRPLFSEL